MLPNPLTPPDCDLRDFPFMPLEIARLHGSEFAIKTTGDEFKAGVLLWTAAFHQVPAGSVPDDEPALMRMAFARNVQAWRKVSGQALRGFVKCSDGRLYHPIVSGLALEAWISKLTQRRRSASANAAKHRLNIDDRIAQIECDLDHARELLATLNPGARVFRRSPATGPGGSSKGPSRSPQGVLQGCQETGTVNTYPEKDNYLGEVHYLDGEGTRETVTPFLGRPLAVRGGAA